MSKHVHPYSHRLGILRDWKSRWFTADKKFREFLKADVLLREHLTRKLRGMYVSGIDIERSEKHMRVIIKTSRPGMLIGRSGEGAVKMKTDIENFLKIHLKLILKKFEPQNLMPLLLDSWLQKDWKSDFHSAE
jgi:small subunit ribosomal protein S3